MRPEDSIVHALPEPVLESLRNHYLAGVTLAEIGYRHNAADEDAVTGALGQALIATGNVAVGVGDRTFIWKTFHYKLRGRGKSAPEKPIGADGIFQIEVVDQFGNVRFRKGLLFQSKMAWRRSDKRLFGQAQDLARYSPSAVIIDYSPSGYRAIPVADVIEARGSRKRIPPERDQRLAEVLGVDFVHCRRGEVGLAWDAANERLLIAGRQLFPLVPEHVIETKIQEIPEPMRLPFRS